MAQQMEVDEAQQGLTTNAPIVRPRKWVSKVGVAAGLGLMGTAAYFSSATGTPAAALLALDKVKTSQLNEASEEMAELNKLAETDDANKMKKEEEKINAEVKQSQKTGNLKGTVQKAAPQPGDEKKAAASPFGWLGLDNLMTSQLNAAKAADHLNTLVKKETHKETKEIHAAAKKGEGLKHGEHKNVAGKKAVTSWNPLEDVEKSMGISFE